MTDLATRFKLKQQQILNSYMCSLARASGQIVIAGNYGSFDSTGQLVIPATNVGTVVTFAAQLVNYLYVDIEIQGNAAELRVYAPVLMLTTAVGTAGSDKGSYKLRIPYCGPISSMNFRQYGYNVKSITVTYATDYLNTGRDLVQSSFTPTTNWTDSGEVWTRDLAAGQQVTIYSAGVLEEDNFKRLTVSLTPTTGIPAAPVSYTYFDGVTTWTMYGINELITFFDKDTPDAYILIDNTSGVSVTVSLTPLLQSFLSISTTYGDEQPIEVLVDEDVDVDWFVDSVAGSDVNPGTKALPFATLAKLQVEMLNNQTGALKCGSYFREMYNDRTGKTGITIKSYGSGRKPIISGADFVTTGEVNWANPNMFVNITKQVDPAQFTLNQLALFENDQQMVQIAAYVNIPGTFWVQSFVGATLILKVSPYPGDQSPDSTGASWTGNSGERKYEITVRKTCIAVNDGSKVDGLHCTRNTSKGAAIIAGVNTQITNCLVNDFLDNGVTQHSGLFQNNIIRKHLTHTNYTGYYFTAPRTTGDIDPTAVSASYDSVPLLITGNEFNSGRTSKLIDDSDVIGQGIYTEGNAWATVIDGNCFVNLYSAWEGQDTSVKTGLTFSNNYVENWKLGIYLGATPFANVSNNLFVLTQELFLVAGSLLNIDAIGQVVDFRNNKCVISNGMVNNAFLVNFASTLKLYYNTFYVNATGGDVEQAIVGCKVNSTIEAMRNIFHNATNILKTLSGANLPNIPLATWDYNLYSGITQYTGMFKFGVTNFVSLANWKGFGRDLHSTLVYLQMPRAELLADTTPEPGTYNTTYGASNYDLTQYKQPIGLLDYYFL